MHALNRRQLLGLGAMVCVPGSAVFARDLLQKKQQQPLLLSAASDGDDHHWVIGLRLDGTGGR